MNNISTVIYGVAGLVLMIFVAFVYNSFQSKKLEIATLKQEISIKEVFIAKLESSNAQIKLLTTKQNESIEAMTVDRDEALFKLEKWRALPPKIKYEVIYKDREVVKSNECDDIKSVINDVRTVDFERL